ncbi:MAG: hypothetical protein JWR12_3031 [Mucilaginibacter sp.]|nr:hypothetical protein [Mucilaginibacter sp.]
MKKALVILSLLISVTISHAVPVKHHIKAAVDSVLICKSSRSYAYHSYECRGLAHCTHGIVKVTKAKAVKMGYRACKICY